MGADMPSREPWPGVTVAEVQEAADRLGVPVKTLYSRRNRGWSWRQASTTPARRSTCAEFWPEVDEAQLTEAARRLGMSRPGMIERYKRGWSWARASQTPRTSETSKGRPAPKAHPWRRYAQ